MIKQWNHCHNILCIRPDNMGDLLMSTPAIRALKQSFHARITVLTSSMAAGIARFIPEIDDVIIFDVPWVKNEQAEGVEKLSAVVDEIRSRQFDAAVLFTVFSQNPLPSAMMAYMAGIPKRLAYCRENPYGLLTDWIPDKEPYTFVQHQVRRDLELVAAVGATTTDEHLSLQVADLWPQVQQKLQNEGVNTKRQWLVAHAGVSEGKRAYPQNYWIEAGKQLTCELGYQLILTGSAAEKNLTNTLAHNIGTGAFPFGGLLSLEEFIVLIKHAPLVLSVNTGTIHIAAATGTPVIVLYALSNPQHLPWKAKGKVLLYDIPEEWRSKNEVLKYVHEHLHPTNIPMVQPSDILVAARSVLFEETNLLIPEMIPLRDLVHQPF